MLAFLERTNKRVSCSSPIVKELYKRLEKKFSESLSSLEESGPNDLISCCQFEVFLPQSDDAVTKGWKVSCVAPSDVSYPCVELWVCKVKPDPNNTMKRPEWAPDDVTRYDMKDIDKAVDEIAEYLALVTE